MSTSTIDMAGIAGGEVNLASEQLEELESQIEGSILRPGDVVAAAFDAEQQAVLTREPDGRSDVVGRLRLNDECR